MTIWLDKDLLDRLDRIGSKADIPRSRLLRNMLEVSCEEMETLDGMGLLTAMRQIEKGVKRFSDLFVCSSGQTRTA